MQIVDIICIFIALFHSACFSGLNLGFFGISRLRLEVQADTGNKGAIRILSLRKDSHFLLATILWGNVSSSVIVTLLTDTIWTGLTAFFISTVGITLFGEIFPQAYLSKNALRASVFLVPFVRVYQFLLYPVAKPTALFLDALLGKEQILYFDEKEFIQMLRRHAQSNVSDLQGMESVGASNFLELDDINIEKEGEVIAPKSIIPLPLDEKGEPFIPTITKDSNDPFVQKIHASHKKWVILTDAAKQPILVLNADHFLRDLMYEDKALEVKVYCHRPIVVLNPNTKLGEVLLSFKVQKEHPEDDVVDQDIILYWNRQKRIITGADILGRLLRGIVKQDNVEPRPPQTP